MSSPPHDRPSSGGGGVGGAGGAARSLAMVGRRIQGINKLKRERRVKFFPNYKGADEDAPLSLGTKLAYCAPTFSTLPIITLLAVYGNQFYEKIGAELSLMSFFIALARSFDVISDPCMSYVTDSFRSPFGRRKPFAVTGCWFYSAFLFLLLYPPTTVTSTQLSMWFGVFYILFFLMNTYCNIPYDALGPELTDNYDDRSRLFFVSGLFDGFGALIAVIIPVLLTYVIALSDWNGTTCSDAFKESFCYLGRSCGLDRDGRHTAYGLITPAFNLTLDNCTNVGLDGTNTATNVTDAALGQFCECMTACDNNCNLKNERSAYMFVAFFFGTWYVVTMSILAIKVTERSQGKGAVADAPPLVPSLLNTLSNKPFKLLLPAWACDAIVNAIVASMTTYFVRYVIQPEFQTLEADGIACSSGVNKENYTPIPGPDAGQWRCNSTTVLGAAVTALLVCAFLGTMPWMFITSKIGKRKAWLLWSLTMAVTNFLFIFTGPGTVNLMIVISGINGLPFGAKFLADAILADIIDYDEFLTGARSEATYTMFKSFLPKICAIPAAAIPIALLNTFGHRPPVNGQVAQQPSSVYGFVVFVTVIIPSLMALLAFWVKTRFPLRSREDVAAIGAGVELHVEGKEAPDPVSGLMYKLRLLPRGKAKDEDGNSVEVPHPAQKYVELLDHFPGLSVVQRLKKDGRAGATWLWNRTRLEVGASVCFAVVFLGASAGLSGLLSDPKISFVPVLSIIFFGVGLTCALFSGLRMAAANQIWKQMQMELDGGSGGAGDGETPGSAPKDKSAAVLATGVSTRAQVKMLSDETEGLQLLKAALDHCEATREALESLVLKEVPSVTELCKPEKPPAVSNDSGEPSRPGSAASAAGAAGGGGGAQSKEQQLAALSSTFTHDATGATTPGPADAGGEAKA